MTRSNAISSPYLNAFIVAMPLPLYSALLRLALYICRRRYRSSVASSSQGASGLSLTNASKAWI